MLILLTGSKADTNGRLRRRGIIPITAIAMSYYYGRCFTPCFNGCRLIDGFTLLFFAARGFGGGFAFWWH
jgi:hypothetical protein